MTEQVKSLIVDLNASGSLVYNADQDACSLREQLENNLNLTIQESHEAMLMLYVRETYKIDSITHAQYIYERGLPPIISMQANRLT